MSSPASHVDPNMAAVEPPIPAPSPHPPPQTEHPLLVVPQVLNNSTTLLQKSPTSSQEDEETFFRAVTSPTASMCDEKEVEVLKELTLITLDSEKREVIAKTAALSVEEEYCGAEEQKAGDSEVYDEEARILALQEDKSFQMQHGFQKPASQQNYERDNDTTSMTSTESPDGLSRSNDDALDAVQELRLIHHPQTSNFLILVDQLRAMREVAETLQSDDVAILSTALNKCERVFERHQHFDQILETGPRKEEAVKALYELVSTSSQETIELIQYWSIVYHALQELVLRIQTITAVLADNSSTGPISKSPKSGRHSFFGRKSSHSRNNGSLVHLTSTSTATLTGLGGQGGAGVTPQFSPEVLGHYQEVCANWEAQMRTFEHLAQAYRAFAAQCTTFTLIHEIDTVSKYYDQSIRSHFEKAQTVFLSSKMLSSLHDQIDYSNLFKTLNKDMALTTAEDRASFPQFVPLFARRLIGERQSVREGRLVEFVSATKTVEANGKKKSMPVSAPPKEYRLIVTTDMIYMCEVVPPSPAGAAPYETTKSLSKKLSRSGSRSALKAAANGSIVSLAPSSGSNDHKPLRLCHEPVLVMDTQISSTPDVVHPPVIQKDMVMVCFYNDTTYILQAESGEVRDAWVDVARALNIEQAKPSASCREQDELFELQQTGSIAGAAGGTGNMATLNLFGGNGMFKFGGGGGSTATCGPSGGKTGKLSFLKRLKSLRRSTANLHAEDNGPTPEIHPDQLTLTDEEERARRMQLSQPSLWEVRRLPLDLGVIPPLEQPIPFRKRHLYDISVQIEDLTTGKSVPGEFGMGIEDRAAYFRDECALFAVLRPARLVPSHAIDRNRDDFFLCKKRMHKGEIHYVEPPYITDFYARSWLHPDMHIEFDPEARTVTIAKMYKITCSTTEIVGKFMKYHAWLMENARISPDNTFLCMDYRSKALRVSKRIERAASSAQPTISSIENTRTLEGGRKYTELGECHMEFRRMSNAPDALSVGFYNPATKRDMAIGVMVFDKTKIKATASSLGLNAINALGATNGVVRVSPSEMSLTMWQTDARTRPRFIKGQRVFETVKSKSLDVFKLVGDRDALDELEEFIRIKMGTDCKARDISETFRLIEIAFQDQVLNASMVEEESVFETRLQKSGSRPHSIRSVTSSSSATASPTLSSLFKENGRLCDDNRSIKSTRSAKSVKSIKEVDEAEISNIAKENEDKAEVPSIAEKDEDKAGISSIAKEDEDKAEVSITEENEGKAGVSSIAEENEDKAEAGISIAKEDEDKAGISIAKEDEDKAGISSIAEKDEDKAGISIAKEDEDKAEVSITEENEGKAGISSITEENEDKAEVSIAKEDEDKTGVASIAEKDEDKAGISSIAKEDEDKAEVSSVTEEDEAEVFRIADDEDENDDDEYVSAHPACEGYLATVLEEDEEEEFSLTSYNNGILSKESSLASSTATFRPKTKEALQEMLLAHERAANSPRSALPQMDLSSFKNLSADGSLADYLSPTKPSSSCGGDHASDEEREDEEDEEREDVKREDEEREDEKREDEEKEDEERENEERENEEKEEMAAPTVADLTKFWAKTTNALVRSGSQSTIRSVDSTASILTNTHAAISASASSSATTPALSPIDSTEKLPTEKLLTPATTTATTTSHQPEIIESSISPCIPPVGPLTELEARVLALKSTASHSAIVAQLTEENVAQANVKDLVQATRYLSKHKLQLSAGFVQSEGGNGEMVLQDGNEPCVEVENHMPVKDLKKRWEEIHRLGI
ncbi:hypothetical protein BG015_011193 [Linnemannia schmuckeri]|uniref:Uncharacterized protein n=1 Tax=Linnemannia schmuckeri TaxID=64567 RepID=A0A9P5S7E1_9FUNG|nr:hypothetical protein BG015_011193 [Linnemannia schmuckeri]